MVEQTDSTACSPSYSAILPHFYNLRFKQGKKKLKEAGEFGSRMVDSHFNL